MIEIARLWNEHLGTLDVNVLAELARHAVDFDFSETD
jgi:hypothetical protein